MSHYEEELKEFVDTLPDVNSKFRLLRLLDDLYSLSDVDTVIEDAGADHPVAYAIARLASVISDASDIVPQGPKRRYWMNVLCSYCIAVWMKDWGGVTCVDDDGEEWEYDDQ